NVLAARDVGNDSDPHSNIVSSTVLNAGGPAATLSPATFIPTLPWIVPDSPYLSAPSFHPIQPDGSDTLQANEARFSAKIPAVGGVLYAIHNTYLNDHIAIPSFPVRAGGHQPAGSGHHSGPDLGFFFSFIPPHFLRVGVRLLNACGLSSYIGCYAMAGQTLNGVTTFGERLTLQS